jgi:hypothetical protein
MRLVTARIFDYSLDGVLAEEGTSFFDFCRDLPDDPAQVERTRGFYERADVHIMGRKHYRESAQYFPAAEDHLCRRHERRAQGHLQPHDRALRWTT